ncbi:protein phosphatase 2C domain-containing protein [Streptomyces sp. NBC_00439]|uniref:protein phosphatase 2C domain-containing protein n=1 Tax=unclassified Streptomyces TaxID=2593676 RepID=UPI00224C9FAD|nr:protein phosphatase 2C domain-containing protein [Streptomyces sp. NBC_00439]MCX5103656.1 protein phosphatase 2C domain-containing protein [Streptomyces sp. NBC_00439]WSX06199.1 protein phosphatase 2C domain-containing protein [Streptomyces sp. NBC_00987]
MTHTGFSVSTGELPGGNRPSEDRIHQAPAAVVVLDGVSTVSDDEPRGGWYAQTLGEHLTAGLTDEPDADLRHLLETALAAMVHDHDLVPGASPAATVSIVRHHGDRIDTLVLADSPVAAFTTSGQVHQVHDDRLARLVADRPERAAYRAALRSGRGFQNPEHRALLQQLRAHQLLHVNRDVPGGYWVAEAIPEAARHAVVRSWPAADIADILVMTDGASSGVEDYGLYSNWEEMAHACRTQGPGNVVRSIHEAEAEDPDGQRWPRYKRHDDKALAHLRLIPTAEPAS